MAKLTTGAKVMIAEVVLLFMIPLLPESILLLTDNLLVRILLVLALLGSSFFGPYVLLVTFIVVLALFGLRNHLKVNKIIIPQEIQQLAPVEQPEAQVAIEQPSYEEPTQDMYEFAPQEDTGSNEFSPVGESIDEKVVFDSPESDGNAGGIFPFAPN